MHKDALVRQIGLEHAGARVGHLHRHGVGAHFKNNDVLELVSFFLADVNFASGKFVDHLVAAKKRHRIARGQIKNRAAQFFLRGRSHLDVEPQANRGADERDRDKWNANARNTHAV